MQAVPSPSPFGPQELMTAVGLACTAFVAYLNVRDRAARAESDRAHSAQLAEQSERFEEQLNDQAKRFETKLEDIVRERSRERDLISDKLDRLRVELTQTFVPGNLAAEQRSALLMRVEKLETEVNKNRDRLHELANQFQTLMLGPMAQIQSALADKARRMAAYEERSRSVDDRLRDVDEELEELRQICKALSK